jgi:hypothetical protein
LHLIAAAVIALRFFASQGFCSFRRGPSTVIGARRSRRRRHLTAGPDIAAASGDELRDLTAECGVIQGAIARAERHNDVQQRKTAPTPVGSTLSH